MQPIATAALVVFSVLFPSKLWFAPDQPLTVSVRPDPGQVLTLVLTDFVGKPIDSQHPIEIAGEKTVDLRELWPQITTPGTYILHALRQEQLLPDFVGTPLIISVREDTRRGAPPGAMVIRMSPLCYAVMETNHGSMTWAFYYDVAPNTVDTILRLAAGGFYDGLTFHRVVPGFVIQGGDPRGDGTGGPGFTINEEFNDREHREGVLSMARESDPMERQGAMPRFEAANSAGSQFFICLDYARTRQLDRRYTVFGKVIEGMETVKAIGALPTNELTQAPQATVSINSLKVLPVTAGKNPYPALLRVTIDRTENPEDPNIPATQPLDPEK